MEIVGGNFFETDRYRLYTRCKSQLLKSWKQPILSIFASDIDSLLIIRIVVDWLIIPACLQMSRSVCFCMWVRSFVGTSVHTCPGGFACAAQESSSSSKLPAELTSHLPTSLSLWFLSLSLVAPSPVSTWAILLSQLTPHWICRQPKRLHQRLWNTRCLKKGGAGRADCLIPWCW